mmetsp:Transcript_44901/g.111532  ORF Transcript_44901/g.111532 Transcript_44901/m.111532 type:complete len:391 (+) Transcript_44901:2-1174(+)
MDAPKQRHARRSPRSTNPPSVPGWCVCVYECLSYFECWPLLAELSREPPLLGSLALCGHLAGLALHRHDRRTGAHLDLLHSLRQRRTTLRTDAEPAAPGLLIEASLDEVEELERGHPSAVVDEPEGHGPLEVDLHQRVRLGAALVTAHRTDAQKQALAVRLQVVRRHLQQMIVLFGAVGCPEHLVLVAILLDVDHEQQQIPWCDPSGDESAFEQWVSVVVCDVLEQLAVEEPIGPAQRRHPLVRCPRRHVLQRRSHLEHGHDAGLVLYLPVDEEWVLGLDLDGLPHPRRLHHLDRRRHFLRTPVLGGHVGRRHRLPTVASIHAARDAVVGRRWRLLARPGGNGSRRRLQMGCHRTDGPPRGGRLPLQGVWWWVCVESIADVLDGAADYLF